LVSDYLPRQLPGRQWRPEAITATPKRRAAMTKAEKDRTYVELVNEVMRESRDPISFDEAEFRLIAEISEEKHRWYPRLLNGSRVRAPLVNHDGELELIVFDEEAQELLWPTLFTGYGQPPSRDCDPVDMRLPGGARTSFRLEHFGRGAWGTMASPEFLRWLKRRKAASGDALIIEAVDVQERRYNVVHEPRMRRDMTAIRKRTEEIENAAFDYVWRNRNQDPEPDLWNLAAHLLVSGYYKGAVPPEPISRIWNRLRPEQAPEYDDRPVIRKHKGARKRPHTVYQLKIILSESAPPIWRRALVSDAATLNDLHQVIQQSMGWTDSHLHQFIIDGQYYSDPAFELGEYMTHIHDEYRVTLSDIAAKNPGRFLYEYDFGDRWIHEIEIEKSGRLNPNEFYPQCVGGERACHPEDCHGIDGYSEFLDAIEDPYHHDHEDSLVWIGGYFDPEYFNLGLLNKKFKAERGFGRGFI
jgi:hypothetical protein